MVGAFTNEEGVRYSPDMMGSLVYAGGLSTKEALQTVGTDGTVLGEELKRIGYEGTVEPGFLKPYAFIELHIEQGPILDVEKIQIRAVGNLQGIHWQRVTVNGLANHAGTTPTALRVDAGLAAAKVNVFLRELVERSGGVATVGTIALKPDAVNVIPSGNARTFSQKDHIRRGSGCADDGAYLSDCDDLCAEREGHQP